MFADGQFFGGFSKTASNSIGRSGLICDNVDPLTSEVRAALEWFIDHVLTGAPRTFSWVDGETYLLFLDGACSETTTSDEWRGVPIGAVLADKRGRLLHCSGHVVDPPLVENRGMSRPGSICV